jgi:hypothetical protein
MPSPAELSSHSRQIIHRYWQFSFHWGQYLGALPDPCLEQWRVPVSSSFDYPLIVCAGQFPACHCGGDDGDCKCWFPRKQARHKSVSSVSSTLSTLSSAFSPSLPSTPILDSSKVHVSSPSAMAIQKTSPSTDFPYPQTGFTPTTPSNVDEEYLRNTTFEGPSHSGKPQSWFMSPSYMQASFSSAYASQQMTGAIADIAHDMLFQLPSTTGYAPSTTTTSGFCMCGSLCSCPGCAEHSNHDGTLTSSVYCSDGCSAGLPCANSIHNHPSPTPSVRPSSGLSPTNSPPMSGNVVGAGSVRLQQQSENPSSYSPNQNTNANINTPSDSLTALTSTLDMSYQNLIDSTPTRSNPSTNLPVHATVQNHEHPTVLIDHWASIPTPSRTAPTSIEGVHVFATGREGEGSCGSSDSRNQSSIIDAPNHLLPLSHSPPHHVVEFQQYSHSNGSFQTSSQFQQVMYEDRSSSASSSLYDQSFSNVHIPLCASPEASPPSSLLRNHSPPSSQRTTTKSGITKKARTSISKALSLGSGSSAAIGATKLLKGRIKQLLPRPASVPHAQAADNYTLPSSSGMYSYSVHSTPTSTPVPVHMQSLRAHSGPPFLQELYQPQPQSHGPLAMPFNRFL